MRDSSASGEGPFVWLEAGTSGGSSGSLGLFSPSSWPRCPVHALGSYALGPPMLFSAARCSVFLALLPAPFLFRLCALSAPPRQFCLFFPSSLGVPVSVVSVCFASCPARTLISIPSTPLILFLAAVAAIPENARASLNRLARSLLAATDEAFSTMKRSVSRAV